MAIEVKVLFFGAAREIVGANERNFTFQDATKSNEAFEIILQESPALKEKFNDSLLFAINQNYVNGDEILQNNDELAIFPPVSGGTEATNHNDFFEITREALNVGEIARRIVKPECGAIVTLDGFVRKWTKGRETLYLEYEAYQPMALSEMRKLGETAHERFGITHLGIVHRLGKMEIGETSVVISVSAAHRKAAFAACEWAILELKRTVPIWKKEFYADGETVSSQWVEGENPAN